jgi:uncharacterized Zn finger protein
MSWWSYKDADDAKQRLKRQLEKRAARGEEMKAVQAPAGKKLASQFWGLAWQRHIEALADYASRLPRGRSYLRQGNVFNLSIEPGLVTAEVAGQQLYEVQIRITTLKPSQWEHIKTLCAGHVGSVLDLLGGRVDAGVMAALSGADSGFLPTAREIKPQCNCPDWADLCKHSAAVLYAIGLEFDAKPEHFFKLRGVDQSELITAATQSAVGTSLDDVVIIPDEQLAVLFGIDV